MRVEMTDRRLQRRERVRGQTSSLSHRPTYRAVQPVSQTRERKLKVQNCKRGTTNNDNRNNRDYIYGAVVTTSRCHSSLGLFDECRPSAKYGRQPSDQVDRLGQRVCR